MYYQHIKPLKQHGDGTLPKNRKEAEERYHDKWKDQSRHNCLEDDDVIDDFAKWKRDYEQDEDDDSADANSQV